jgi:sialidase-1
MLAVAGTSLAATINVPADYATIQAAVNAASNGDEVIVAPGTYVGKALNTLGKAITIKASGTPEVTIIDGEGARRVITCENNEGADTVIENFTITGDSAYSNLVKLSDNRAGLFYEKGGYATMTFVTMSIEELEKPVKSIKLGDGIPLTTDGKWKIAKESIRGGGRGKHLWAARGIKSGDFTIKATLAIDALNGTAASFMLDGNHFGFDGRSSSAVFVEGPDFGETKSVGKSADFIKAGKSFEFAAIRTGNDLVFNIDGKQVWKTQYPKPSIHRFGFRPHRATVTVTAFTATADFLPAPLPLLTLYRSGTDGYHTYRIPALLTTKKGTMLAFCEGRKNSRHDAGNIDLLVKRSEDGGKTWSPQQVVWDDAGNTCGNPAPVQDRETGTIFLLSTWNLGHDHEGEIINGHSKDTRRIFIMKSTDDGNTWSKAKDITKTTKQPDWTWYATGPGSGIQMVAGPHKGRLIIPCDHVEKQSKKYFSHIIYSDDHGKTWKIGGRTPTGNANECMVAELPGGKLMLNMRNADRSKRSRAVSTSTDGGMTWSALRRDPILIEPICQAGFISYAPGDKAKGNWLLFSNPASRKGRVRMTVRLSKDGGKTWPSSKLLHAGPSAYSDLTVLPNGDIACFYEGGSRIYGEINLAILPLKQLSQ